MAKNYKYCIVPDCRSTSIRTPDKRFITVPSKDYRRKNWLKAVRTSQIYAANSIIFVCEDHFNLREDAANWMQVQLGATNRIHIKEFVVPHIFECHPQRSNAQPVKERLAAVHRARRSILQDLLPPTFKSPSTCTKRNEKSLHTVTQRISQSSFQDSPVQGRYALSPLRLPCETASSKKKTAGPLGFSPTAMSSSASPFSTQDPPVGLQGRYVLSPLRFPYETTPSKRKRAETLGCAPTALTSNASPFSTQDPPEVGRYVLSPSRTSWIITSEKRKAAPTWKITPEKRKAAPTWKVTPEKWIAAETLCDLSEGESKRIRLEDDQHSAAKVTKNISVQKTPVKFENKGISIRPRFRSKKIECTIIGSADVRSTVKSIGTSPIKLKKKVQPNENSDNEEISSVCTEASVSSYVPSADASGNESNTFTKLLVQQVHLEKVKSDPMFFLGVPIEYYYLINVLAESLPTTVLNVLICLQKIRLSQSFKWLAYDYGVSQSFCSQVFRENVVGLNQCLSQLITWPDKLTLMRRLPLNFFARYSDVQSVIDCFEIEIEKPSDPIDQTLSWSNYKKCNTLKYCVSCTADGLISFVSDGFGGRTSDTKLVESCGYLEALPNDVAVMADRGFKGLATKLAKKNCKLIRPPSAPSNYTYSKEEAKEAKRIACLRINVERVIRRIREFSLLKPHACINHSLCKYTDSAVKIACGLINLQGPLLKNLA